MWNTTRFREEVIIVATYNERVRAARLALGLTQAELGGRIGRSKQWVAELELNRIRLTYATARDIAAALGTTPDAILLPGSDTDTTEAI